MIFYKSLRINDRATAIMACGTGKTLVALWVAEKKKCPNDSCIITFSCISKTDSS